MVVCAIVWGGMIILFYLYKKRRLPEVLEKGVMRKMFFVLIMSNLIAMVLFGMQLLEQKTEEQVERNTYGGGKKAENYKVTIDGALEDEPLVIEIEEQEYTHEETLKMFEEIMEKLDQTILGKNESFNRVEYDLELVSSLENYPAQIQWEVEAYNVLDTEGNILEDYDVEEGTLVELRGRIKYAEEEAVYVVNAMVFPKVKSKKEQWQKALTDLIQEKEKQSRKEGVFVLPSSLNGREIHWTRSQEPAGYYIIGLGIFAAVLIPVKIIREEQEKKKKRQEQLLRDYPEIVSKFTLLLSTGMTIKAVWNKIVQAYEENKKQTGEIFVYEEMRLSAREIQGGISEKEAYERFGQRCGTISYIKFGALLSQNLRKGNKGLTDLLTLESIQAFEERKSRAKKLGEEASTKLMVPMFIMLAIVLVMVIVPAFLSMQI